MQMGRSFCCAVVVALLASAPGWARVNINQPKADDKVGRFIDVAGKASPRATVAVSFKVVRTGREQAIYEAPPTLQETDNAGAFKLRLALPPVENRARALCTVTASEVGSGAEAARVTVGLAADEGGGKALDPAIPTVTTPTEGGSVRIGGVVVEGRSKPGELIIISTKCFSMEDGEFISDVPGIRHYPNEDGSFSFRVATPSVALGKKVRVRYEIRVFTATPDHRSPAIYIHMTEPT